MEGRSNIDCKVATTTHPGQELYWLPLQIKGGAVEVAVTQSLSELSWLQVATTAHPGQELYRLQLPIKGGAVEVAVTQSLSELWWLQQPTRGGAI
jgi:hypothetical protein